MAAIDTIPPYLGEIVRCLVTVAGEPNWYRDQPPVGSIAGDVDLTPDLAIGRIRLRNNPRRLTFNRGNGQTGAWDAFASGSALVVFLASDAGTVQLPVDTNDIGSGFVTWHLNAADETTLDVSAGAGVNIVISTTTRYVPPAPLPAGDPLLPIFRVQVDWDDAGDYSNDYADLSGVMLSWDVRWGAEVREADVLPILAGTRGELRLQPQPDRLYDPENLASPLAPYLGDSHACRISQLSPSAYVVWEGVLQPLVGAEDASTDHHRGTLAGARSINLERRVERAQPNASTLDAELGAAFAAASLGPPPALVTRATVPYEYSGTARRWIAALQMLAGVVLYETNDGDYGSHELGQGGPQVDAIGIRVLSLRRQAALGAVVNRLTSRITDAVVMQPHTVELDGLDIVGPYEPDHPEAWGDSNNDQFASNIQIGFVPPANHEWSPGGAVVEVNEPGGAPVRVMLDLSGAGVTAVDVSAFVLSNLTWWWQDSNDDVLHEITSVGPDNRVTIAVVAPDPETPQIIELQFWAKMNGIAFAFNRPLRRLRVLGRGPVGATLTVSRTIVQSGVTLAEVNAGSIAKFEERGRTVAPWLGASWATAAQALLDVYGFPRPVVTLTIPAWQPRAALQAKLEALQPGADALFNVEGHGASIVNVLTVVSVRRRWAFGQLPIVQVTGLEVTPAESRVWILGVSQLGVDTVLG